MLAGADTTKLPLGPSLWGDSVMIFMVKNTKATSLNTVSRQDHRIHPINYQNPYVYIHIVYLGSDTKT